ncbi:MAG TPA: hypothetical protein PK523_11870, partial [Elusimicrobiales bacterium]|nr:hypothetical protein [Elusimicrobiales bacterium]
MRAPPSLKGSYYLFNEPGPVLRSVFFILLLLAPSSVFAVAKTWDGGGGDPNWYTDANWNPDGVPSPADDVTLDAAALSVAVDVSSPAISFNTLVLGNSGATNTVSLTLSTGIASGGSVTVYGGASLISGTTHQLAVTGSLTVYSGGVVTHNVNLNTLTAMLNLRITGNLDLQAGGWIHGDAMGYSTGGPGAGTNGGANGGAGGGHGGAGGQGGNLAAGGAAYDSFDIPLDAGSKGGDGSSFAVYPGGAGGGLLRIEVSGSATVNGTLSAAGGAGSAGLVGNSNHGAAGGGSGGAVHLIAGSLTGGGLISAKGGQAGDDNNDADKAGGGGGGLIRLDISTYDYNDFSGVLDVSGGPRSVTAGGLAADGSPGRIEPSTATFSDNSSGQRSNSITIGQPPEEGVYTTVIGNETIHVFTSSGTLTVPAGSAGNVQVLIVGGGGGGGKSDAATRQGGGGGAGGLIYDASVALTP